MHLDHKTFLNVLEELKCEGHSPRGDTEKRNIAHVFAHERYVADLPTVEAPHFICQPCVSTVSLLDHIDDRYNEILSPKQPNKRASSTNFVSPLDTML